MSTPAISAPPYIPKNSHTMSLKFHIIAFLLLSLELCTLCLFVLPADAGLQIVLIGLGGGGLPMFLRLNIPNVRSLCFWLRVFESSILAIESSRETKLGLDGFGI